MNEATKILDSIRKDWGLIPNASKAFAVFSALSVWYVSRAWGTEKYKHIFYASVLALNFLIFFTFIFLKPYFLRRKYSLSGFASGDYELLNSGGIWFVVDHKKRQIKWVANMATFVELGLRHITPLDMPKDQSTIEYLKAHKLAGYKAGRYIMIMGRRGEGIKEE